MMVFKTTARPAFKEFKREALQEYRDLLDVTQAFRTHYGLQNYSLKDIDKFLWRVGSELTGFKESHR